LREISRDPPAADRASVTEQRGPEGWRACRFRRQRTLLRAAKRERQAFLRRAAIPLAAPSIAKPRE